jgi:predicted N-acetyltransferase YhbS
MRAATLADSEALAAFNADHLRSQDAGEPQASLAEWTRDLVAGARPGTSASDATIIEDGAGAIVSAMFLISHTWSYGGVRIAVGQPELVGTRPEFRGRGLVRTLFELVHARSAARGDLMQVITGIPWFYRQFGYEFGIGRGGGGRLFPSELASRPADGGMRVRAARVEDAGFFAELDASAAGRHVVHVPRDAAQWRYEMTGHRAGSATAHVFGVIEDASTARPLGAFVHAPKLWSAGTLGLTMLEVVPGVSWRAVVLTALDHLRAAGEALAVRDGKPFGGVSFWFLGREHPAYDAIRVRYDAADTWYAVYTRVPDVAAFLRAAAPVLERRLAASRLAGHTGDLKLSTYRDGARLVLEDGRVKTVERWQPSFTLVGQENGIATTDPRRPDAQFPDLTILQLLFGLRSLDDLTAWYPDCVVRTPATRALVNALFPRQPSFVWPIL